MPDSIRSVSPWPRIRSLPCSIALAAFGFAGPAAAQAAPGSATDSSFYLQYGTHGPREAYGIGLTRDWPLAWAWTPGDGRLSGYWAAEAQVWTYEPADSGRDRATRLGKFELAPIFRFRGDGGRSPWFVDAGIGLTLTTRLYRSGMIRSSTAFNFGDQVAIGWLLGPTRAHEVALRFEHMSNASIKQPNPAINFYQLRYAYRFGS